MVGAALLQQHVSELHAAEVAGEPERSHAIPLASIHLRPLVSEQQPDDLHMGLRGHKTASSSAHQRRAPSVVAQRRVGPSFEQERHDIPISMVGAQDQSRMACVISGIYNSAPVEQQAYRLHLVRVDGCVQRQPPSVIF